jgi:hypothetical protein
MAMFANDTDRRLRGIAHDGIVVADTFVVVMGI